MAKFTPKEPRKHVDGIETYEKRVHRLYAGRDNLPVIVKDTPEWSEWMKYFEHIGHDHAKPGSFAKIRGRLTVPELDPQRFDPGFHCEQKPFNYRDAAE